MKIRWLMLTALCLLLVGPAVAQNSWFTAATANVPFDFVVNGTTLPAGNYVVRTYGTGNVLMIQNRDMGQNVLAVNHNIFLNPPDATHESSKLVFGLNNGQQVLHQICIAGDDHTHDLVHGDDVAELVAAR